MGCQTPADCSKPGAGWRLVPWEGHGLGGSATASPMPACPSPTSATCQLPLSLRLPFPLLLSPLFYLGPPSPLWLVGQVFRSSLTPWWGLGCPAAFPEPPGSALSWSFFSAPCGLSVSTSGSASCSFCSIPRLYTFCFASPSPGLWVTWKSPAFPFPRERSEVTKGPLGAGSCWGREWSGDKGPKGCPREQVRFHPCVVEHL